MKSSRQSAAENRGISGHFYKLHQRLHQAINLGSRVYDGKELKWRCTDIEIQRHVVRSIGSFLDCVSSENVYHPLVKDSIADIVRALVTILQNRSKAVINMASDVVVKLITVLPNMLLQPYLLDVLHSLLCVLSSEEVDSMSCATALNIILSNLGVRREKKTWDILVETSAVSCIVDGIKRASAAALPIAYFQEMVNLLVTILQQWPQSRYPVWNDAMFLEALRVMRSKSDFSVKVAVLKLYSALALCGNGANKLLEDGEGLLQMTVLCMGKSYPISVRTEGFRLAQCLARNEQGCLTMMNMCCKPIVRSIIDGMSGWAANSGKTVNEDVTLLVEAFRLAMISRWAGRHHDLFWKYRIDRALLSILLNGLHDEPYHGFSNLDKQISIVREGLNASVFHGLRPYVWNFLAWLAAHCKEDFSTNWNGSELRLDILIICACVSFVDSIQRGRQICQDDASDAVRSESVSRTVLMLIFSPSKYISSKARDILSKLLVSTEKDILKYLLRALRIQIPNDNFGMLDFLQTSINLIALVCYSSLPQHQSQIVKSGGINTLMGLVKWCLSNDIRLGRSSLPPHWLTIFSDKTCCWVFNEDWEDNDILMLYSLWGLSELIHSTQTSSDSKLFSGSTEYTEAQFLSTLHEICTGPFSPGTKWYAALILNYFGVYGFPSKLGRCIGKAFNMNEYADTLLNLAKGESLSVHGVVLAVRCPSLLPHSELPHNEISFDEGKFRNEIRLSSHVDNEALVKLLEFVYLGFFSAGEELVKKVRVLAKHCRLKPLLVLLDGRRPKWGTCFPKYDLSVALGTAGHHFSDIILEAKETESVDWTCDKCSHVVPHIHSHKIVLWSRCDYLRAVFESGMTESNSRTMKVPVSWKAMVKLVNWFYSDDLPSPPSGCLWGNMDNEQRLSELQPYLELCWLAEFWFLEAVQDLSYTMVVTCLDSARPLSIKVIKIASDFSLWKLVEVAANFLAPLYRQLCHSGDLESLNEEIVDVIRAASVRLSQEELSM